MLGTILEPWLIHCKSADPSVGVDAHLVHDIIRLPKSLLSPGTNNWATGKMWLHKEGENWLRLTNNFVVLKNYWVSETLAPGFLRGLPPGMQGLDPTI